MIWALNDDDGFADMSRGMVDVMEMESRSHPARSIRQPRYRVVCDVDNEGIRTQPPPARTLRSHHNFAELRHTQRLRGSASSHRGEKS